MSTATHRGFRPILLAAAAIGIANSVVFALLGNLQDTYGFSDAGLGLIAGSGFLVGLVGQVLLAPFADRGHAKRLMLGGLGLAVAGSALFAAASSLPLLVAARAVVGLSNSLFFPAARAIVISLDESGVARRLGTMSGVELSGFVTGPVIGALLVGPFGLRVPFLVAGSFALAAVLMLLPRPLPEPPIGEQRRLAFDLLAIPTIRSGVAMSVALFLPVGFYDATLDRYLTDLGASDALVGLSFLVYGIPFALLASTGGRLADQRGALRIALLSSVLVGPLTALYGHLPTANLIVLFSAAEGVIQAMGVPATQALVAKGAPLGRAAAAQGLSGAATLLIATITAYSAGPIYQHLGPGWMFGIAGAGVLVFAALAVGQRERGGEPVPATAGVG